MEHIRAFLGIPLPGAYQDGLAALGPRLAAIAPARLALTRPGSWHLTLKFLGHTPRRGPTGIQAVGQALAGVVWEAFVLLGGGGGFFPNAARPRVVYVGLSRGARDCRELAGRVEAALSALGVPSEPRAFIPHLTVARVRDFPKDRGGKGGWDEVAGRLARAVWPECVVDRFVLYQSILGPHGPRYEVVEEFPARGVAPGGGSAKGANRAGCPS
ncbi:RNA 2',3'-cyclic phosphodiesterase [Desulfolutivibrio sulfoxidireducens]|uniref:RNA 2',3'-cyclic phosphodiesterase n=1 Tax=Desulfolutivibrio sulfoxidireducens TaxID=2773299 RepID=UPI00159D9E5F|nr:RNA 2',3'-cyclic phosphodiesterase [Desulfolutivibrio sulfoxidireducens]QLA15039.1 RNA 2',3'-cyclic phosphodiesterase [Desulfolutivibrio sulfoxidireducens]